MKSLPECDICKGSLHPVYNMPDKYWCPTCKRYYTRSSFGWTEAHA